MIEKLTPRLGFVGPREAPIFFDGKVTLEFEEAFQIKMQLIELRHILEKESEDLV